MDKKHSLSEVLKMSRRLVTLFSVLFLCSGCGVIQSAGEAPVIEAPANEGSGLTATPGKVFPKRIVYGGWEILVEGSRDGGRIYKVDEYTEHEAVDTWQVVDVKITNKTGKRQKADDGPEPYMFTFFDAKSQTFDTEQVVYKFDIEKLMTPISPNETRAYEVLVDVPKGTKLNRLVTDPFTDGSPQISW